MSELLPVTVVTGFLGAGKTTLVNELLASVPRGEIAVIVNEHGAVGIDGELLAARVQLLIEVTGGCVCCTTHAELVNALDRIVRTTPRPRRVLIETSGAASPAGVLRAVIGGGKSGELTLDGVIAVFDATRVDAYLDQDLALEQLGFADLVVLSRANALARDALLSVQDRLAAQNGAAVFVCAEQGRSVEPVASTLDELLGLRRQELRAQPVLPRLQKKHVYESVSLTCDGAVDGERFAEFVEAEVAQFAGRIFRIKGILAVDGIEQRMIVQGVGDAIDVSFGEPWGTTARTSRLVIVGFGLDSDALRRCFATCA